jgi:ribosome biogenesis GTPase / thiamine phosphate phosphatase
VEQIVATNVDTLFLVTGLDHNYNLRRIERYLAIAWESGAQPVVVLNKSDLHAEPAAVLAEVNAIVAGVPVVLLSAARGDGLAGLGAWLAPGRTIAFLGSSGVGKSTLINRLIGTDRQVTSAVSGFEDKGRHTTTRRELMLTPSGALVIDTPGMRELQLWDVDAAALDTTFSDIAALAASCRFNDCTHEREPGCALQAALNDGSLDEARWQSYLKLQREQSYVARRADPRLARENKAAWKKINKTNRSNYRLRERE